MTICRSSLCGLFAIIILLPAGCASLQSRLAGKGEVNTDQLLAAARLYEKEGKLETAEGIYQHVLRYHPSNEEAKEGLALVRQGKLRIDDPQRLLAATNRLPQTGHSEPVSDRMADLIVQAARNPRTIEVEPTPAMTAATEPTRQPVRSAISQASVRPGHSIR